MIKLSPSESILSSFKPSELDLYKPFKGGIIVVAS